MGERWVYCARVTHAGNAVVDFVKVDPTALPGGVPSFATRHEAKEAWRGSMRRRERTRMTSAFDSWSSR